MEHPTPTVIPWSHVLGGRSVALRSFDRPEDVADFLPPSLSELDRVLARRKAMFADPAYRRRLAKAIRSTSERLGAPKSTLASADVLEDPSSFLVITGQQAGLLTGPLYTVFKAATAVAMARRLSRQRAERFLPCFWCASEDHDFDEVRAISILDQHSSVREFTVPPPPGESNPVYDLPADICPYADMRRFLEETLRPTEFTATALQLVEETHQASRGFSEWMVRVLWRLFEPDGLLVALPEDGFYQTEARSILSAEIKHPSESVKTLRDAGKRLADRGLEPGIHKAEHRSSFFVVTPREHGLRRLPVFFENGSFRSRERVFSREDLLALLEDDPRAISAGAPLRPVCQDAALPTAVAVLGPGEIGYYAQIAGIYAMHGVPQPACSVRLSATLIPARLHALIENIGLTFGDFSRDTRWLLREALKHEGPDASTKALEELRNHIARAFSVLRDEAGRLDPTIIGALEKDRKRLEKTTGQVESLITRRRADAEENLRRRIEALQAVLFPGGTLQERTLNILYFLNLYGPDLLLRIKELAGGDTARGHYLVPL